MSVYITASGAYLPGEPIDNETMESRLGFVADTPSRYREVVLRHNGIKSRHYAIDADGRQTHLNEELIANAIRQALETRGLPLSEFGMLAVGTTIPDLVMPGFGPMVHGRLGADGTAAPMEVLSTNGVCATGAAALLHAWTSLLVGRHERAIAGASELMSAMMRSTRFEHESEVHQARSDVPEAFQYFNADFLRWMLSDGAGAVVLEREPAADGRSLRIDWIELTSFAHEWPVCMYMGASDPTDVSVGKTWLGKDSAAAAHDDGMLLVRQDTNLLAEGIAATTIGELQRLMKKGQIDAEQGYDWFLPHFSSYFFKDKLVEGVADLGIKIPADGWFTNLATKGNTGSASIFIMIDEALRQGRFQPGDRILAMVPESGRFTMSFMQFTCV